MGFSRKEYWWTSVTFSSKRSFLSTTHKYTTYNIEHISFMTSQQIYYNPKFVSYNHHHWSFKFQISEFLYICKQIICSMCLWTPTFIIIIFKLINLFILITIFYWAAIPFKKISHMMLPKVSFKESACQWEHGGSSFLSRMTPQEPAIVAWPNHWAA